MCKKGWFGGGGGGALLPRWLPGSPRLVNAAGILRFLAKWMSARVRLSLTKKKTVSLFSGSFVFLSPGQKKRLPFFFAGVRKIWALASFEDSLQDRGAGYSGRAQREALGAEVSERQHLQPGALRFGARVARGGVSGWGALAGEGGKGKGKVWEVWVVLGKEEAAGIGCLEARAWF